MRTPYRVLIAAPLALALIAGCGKSGDTLSPTASSSNVAEQTEVTQELATNPTLVEDGGLSAIGDQTNASLSAGNPAIASVAAVIRPLFFFRTIRDIDRHVVIDFAGNDSTGHPTIAYIKVERTLHGSFNIVVPDSGSGGGLGDAALLRKPLVDRWVRHLVAERVSGDSNNHRRWRIVGTSSVQVTSKDATTAIHSVHVQGAGLDTTLTDPLQVFRLRNVLKVTPDVDVTITVTTGKPDDVVLLYAADRRFRFTPNGDGTYTGTWRSPMLAGCRHVGINALSNGTLFDDAMPYDSQAWIIPYVVTGTDLEHDPS